MVMPQGEVADTRAEMGQKKEGRVADTNDDRKDSEKQN